MKTGILSMLVVGYQRTSDEGHKHAYLNEKRGRVLLHQGQRLRRGAKDPYYKSTKSDKVNHHGATRSKRDGSSAYDDVTACRLSQSFTMLVKQ
jgi:hypothetical protein